MSVTNMVTTNNTIRTIEAPTMEITIQIIRTKDRDTMATITKVTIVVIIDRITINTISIRIISLTASY